MEKMTNAEAIETLRANYPDACFEQLREAVDKAIKALEADVLDTNVGDMISRQAAIDALDVLCQEHRYKIPGKIETYSQYNEAWQDALDRAEGAIGNLPSAEPTLYGYKIEHLAYIARVMQKEGITAEDAARTFDDLGRAVSWTIDEVRQKMEEVIYDYNTCKI